MCQQEGASSCRPEPNLWWLTPPSRGPDGIELHLPYLIPGQVGIEYSADLSAESWIDLGNFSPSPTTGGMKFLDPTPLRMSRTMGFYRAFVRDLP
jgi:hypothetical protein